MIPRLKDSSSLTVFQFFEQGFTVEFNSLLLHQLSDGWKHKAGFKLLMCQILCKQADQIFIFHDFPLILKNLVSLDSRLFMLYLR